MPRFRASSVIKALNHAIEGSKDVCFEGAGNQDACDLGRKIAIQTLQKFSEVKTIEELRRAIRETEAEGRNVCDNYEGPARRSCTAGRIAVIGLFRNELASRTKIELTGIRPPQLGIFISPGEKCPKGFEKIKLKGGRNHSVAACRLADGYRKHKPEDRPKGKPLRRLWRKYGPGVEADKILPLHEHRVRKSSRKLQED